MIKYTLAVVLVVFGVLLGGCSISPETRKRAEAVAAAINAADQTASRKETEFQALKKGPSYNFLRRYADDEKWDNTFAQAHAEAKAAADYYEGTVKPILSRNKRSEEAALVSALTNLDRQVAGVYERADDVERRIRDLELTRRDAPKMLDGAKGEVEQIKGAYEPVAAKAVKAQKEHTSASVSIRLAKLTALKESAETTLSLARKELAAGDAANYAAVITYCKGVGSAVKEMREAAAELDRGIDQLYVSYSKILVDMREEYFVQIGRTSWDESADWPTEHEYRYPPRKVDEGVFEYFDEGIPEDDSFVLATYGMGWGSSFSVNADQAKWNVLGIDPKESWPSWDDQAEYWLAETSVKYFHKYLLVENESTKDSEWTEVAPEAYDASWENLGMALVEKPYGMFEDEAERHALPAGMSYVGNTKYGEWKKDPQTGSSFWAFYGQYHFMSSMLGLNRPYYYNEWDSWNRDYRGRSAYYGVDDKDNERTRYGTYSGTLRGSPRFASTNFNSTGGFKNIDADIAKAKQAGHTVGKGSSVRGAGRSARGGGPGGGGK